MFSYHTFDAKFQVYFTIETNGAYIIVYKLRAFIDILHEMHPIYEIGRICLRWKNPIEDLGIPIF